MPEHGEAFDLRNAELKFTNFSPGAVARITGFSQELQRVWRKRGQIPAVDGQRASFSAIQAAELFVRHQLSKHGVSPEVTTKIGARAGRTALYFAFLSVDGACEVLGARNAVDRFLAGFEKDDDLAARMASASETDRYLWCGDTRAFAFVDDIQKAIIAERSISITCIDLAVLGARLGKSAERPLITVSLRASAKERIVRQLTYAAQDDLV